MSMEEMYRNFLNGFIYLSKKAMNEFANYTTEGGKNMLLDAKSAREKAASGTDDRTKEGLEAAEKCINQAVKEGTLWCWCYTYLTDRAVLKLNELGYSVENCSNQRDGTMFKIKWY